MVYEHKLTEPVLEDMSRQSMGLNGKIKKYLEMLDEQGRSLEWPYKDKIEGYQNLFELRPKFDNVAYRMFYFWRGNTAFFVHTAVEKGQKRKNQREYKTAEQNKQVLEKILSAHGGR
jgi:hypothetical protein